MLVRRVFSRPSFAAARSVTKFHSSPLIRCDKAEKPVHEEQKIVEPTEQAKTNEQKQETNLEEDQVDPHTETIQKLEAKLTEATEANKDKHDQLLRTLAELDNTRKRAQAEVENAHKFAVGKFAKALLEVADNLHRAAESVPEEMRESEEMPVLKTLYEGVVLTDKEFHKTLSKFGVDKMEPLGQKFDPNLHEALFEMPPGEKSEPGSVGAVMQSGYVLHERTLRAAKVGIVSKPAA